MRMKLLAAAVCLLFLLAGCGDSTVRLTPGESGTSSAQTEPSETPAPAESSESSESAETSRSGESSAETSVPPETSGASSFSEAQEPDESDSSGTSDTSGTSESSEPEESEPRVWSSPRVGKSDPVGDDWFADAAFVGNSLTEGFYAWSGVQYGDAYASTSMSVLGVADVDAVTLADGSTGTILEGLAQKPYGKIYILLGINEISMAPADFRAAYETMLDRIQAIQPDADIYIEGLSPVTKWKSDSSAYFNMDNVRAYNCELFELAFERGLYYIDLCEALAGNDGYLPDDADTDGVHFTMSYYPKWYEYLKTHTR